MEAYTHRILYFTILFWMLNATSWASDTTSSLEIDIQIEVATNISDATNNERTVVALIPKNNQSNKPAPKIIGQKNAQFSPFITIAQTGSMIKFPNQDEFAHHVYSFSKTLSFELPLYSKDQKHELLAKNPGIVPIGCNIHDWMLGYIVIVDTPYFTFLNKNVATFKHLPVGEYQMRIWHPSMDDFWVRPVSISKADTHLTVTLPFSLSSVNPLPTPDFDDAGDY